MPVLLPSEYWCNVFGYWSLLSASHAKTRETKLEGSSGGHAVCSPTKSRANFNEVPGGLSSPALSVSRDGDSWAPLPVADYCHCENCFPYLKSRVHCPSSSNLQFSMRLLGGCAPLTLLCQHNTVNTCESVYWFYPRKSFDVKGTQTSTLCTQNGIVTIQSGKK